MKEVVTEAADNLSYALKKDLGDHVIGPAAPVVNRVRGLYLMEILIKMPKDVAVIRGYKQAILNHFDLIHADKRFKSVVLQADVDPM